MTTSSIDYNIFDEQKTVDIFIKVKANEPFTVKDLFTSLKDKTNKDIYNYDIVSLEFEIVDEIVD